MIELYDSAYSGNCYKVRLVLAQLGIPYRRVPLDLAKGDARTPEFRERFPLRRVPAVVLEDGTVLAESNAIISYFGEGTRLVPADRLARAQMLQWMFWEQYSHEPYVAVVRAWCCYFGVPAGKEAELEERRAKGVDALGVMDRHLERRDWFAGDAYSLADVALYAYTHVAGEGKCFDLVPFRAIRRWFERVRSQPKHVAIDE